MTVPSLNLNVKIEDRCERHMTEPLYRCTIRFLTENAGGGYLVEYRNLPECMSDRETIEEAIANAKDPGPGRGWSPDISPAGQNGARAASANDEQGRKRSLPFQFERRAGMIATRRG